MPMRPDISRTRLQYDFPTCQTSSWSRVRFCGEQLEIYVEPDDNGTFVQDGEVCCNPWGAAEPSDAAYDVLAGLLPPATRGEVDPFDRVQLAEVVRVCRRSRSLSEAGRRLFTVSRTRKAVPNDVDRPHLPKVTLRSPSAASRNTIALLTKASGAEVWLK
jgi:hypothetical protein